MESTAVAANIIIDQCKKSFFQNKIYFNMGNIVNDRKFCVFRNAIKRNKNENCITNNEMNVKSIEYQKKKLNQLLRGNQIMNNGSN